MSMVMKGVQGALDPSEWDTYSSIIDQPRDLGTIEETLRSDGYGSLSAFCKDVDLCFENAKKYNKTRYKQVADAATAMHKVFKQNMDKVISSLHSNKASMGSTGANATVTAAPSHAVTDVVNFSAEQANTILETVNRLESSRWFTVPVDTSLPHYQTRVSHPVDFPLIREKIRKRKYQTADQFALDMRRVFGNALKYNVSTVDVDPDLRRDTKIIRQDTKNSLFQFEQEWVKQYGHACAPALEHLHECLQAIDKLLEIKRPGQVIAIITSFIDHVKHYWGTQADSFMKKYSKVVKRPMDYGTIISNIVEANYSTLDELIADARLVAENCEKWFAHENGVHVSAARQQDNITQDAWTLHDRLVKELSRVAPHILSTPGSGSGVVSQVTASTKSNTKQSATGAARKETSAGGTGGGSVKLERRKSGSSAAIARTDSSHAVLPASSPSAATSSSSSAGSSKGNKPPPLKDRYIWVLSMVKEHYLVDDRGRAGVQTCWPFNKAVDPMHYPSYPTIIKNPMDLTQMEKKVRGERYPNMLVFLNDMQLIRDNCYTFNKDASTEGIRYLADLTLSNFQYLLREIAQEVMDCNDPSFVTRVLPEGESRNIIFTPHPLNKLSEEFYKSRIEQQRKPPPPPPPPVVAGGDTVLKLKRQNSSSSVLSADPAGDVDDSRYPDVVVPNAGKGKRGGKGKQAKQQGKKSLKSASELDISEEPEEVITAPPLARQSSIGTVFEWEQPCVDLLKKLTKHEFLDISRSSTRVFKADFFRPVVELFPELADAYLEVIRNPMDFTIITTRLSLHGFLDAQDVYEKIILIFQNTIEFNEPNLGDDDSPDSELARKMVVRSKHMLKYIAWLAHEMLPVADDMNDDNPEALGLIRATLRDQHRNERILIVSNAPLDSTKECFALLKRFENRKFAKEYSFFSSPVPKSVSDYSVYVRHPMDFRSVREKLDREKYTSYGQFLKDVRLIFTNAKAYNRVHMEVDELSKQIYDAAVMFEEMLEGLINKEFSIDVAERVLYNNIKAEEEARAMAAKWEQESSMNRELEEYRRQEIERLKATNMAFAMDQIKREQSSGALASTTTYPSASGGGPAIAAAAASGSIVVRRQSSGGKGNGADYLSEYDIDNTIGTGETGGEEGPSQMEEDEEPYNPGEDEAQSMTGDDNEPTSPTVEGEDSRDSTGIRSVPTASVPSSSFASLRSALDAKREKIRIEAWDAWVGAATSYSKQVESINDGVGGDMTDDEAATAADRADIASTIPTTAWSSSATVTNQEAMNTTFSSCNISTIKKPTVSSSRGFVIVKSPDGNAPESVACSGNQSGSDRKALLVSKAISLRRRGRAAKRVLSVHSAFSTGIDDDDFDRNIPTRGSVGEDECCEMTSVFSPRKRRYEDLSAWDAATQDADRKGDRKGYAFDDDGGPQAESGETRDKKRVRTSDFGQCKSGEMSSTRIDIADGFGRGGLLDMDVGCIMDSEQDIFIKQSIKKQLDQTTVPTSLFQPHVDVHVDGAFTVNDILSQMLRDERRVVTYSASLQPSHVGVESNRSSNSDNLPNPAEKDMDIEDGMRNGLLGAVTSCRSNVENLIIVKYNTISGVSLFRLLVPLVSSDNDEDDDVEEDEEEECTQDSSCSVDDKVKCSGEDSNGANFSQLMSQQSYHSEEGTRIPPESQGSVGDLSGSSSSRGCTDAAPSDNTKSDPQEEEGNTSTARANINGGNGKSSDDSAVRATVDLRTDTLPESHSVCATPVDRSESVSPFDRSDESASTISQLSTTSTVESSTLPSSGAAMTYTPSPSVSDLVSAAQVSKEPTSSGSPAETHSVAGTNTSTDPRFIRPLLSHLAPPVPSASSGNYTMTSTHQEEDAGIPRSTAPVIYGADTSAASSSAVSQSLNSQSMARASTTPSISFNKSAAQQQPTAKQMQMEAAKARYKARDAQLRAPGRFAWNVQRSRQRQYAGLRNLVGRIGQIDTGVEMANTSEDAEVSSNHKMDSETTEGAIICDATAMQKCVASVKTAILSPAGKILDGYCVVNYLSRRYVDVSYRYGRSNGRRGDDQCTLPTLHRVRLRVTALMAQQVHSPVTGCIPYRENLWGMLRAVNGRERRFCDTGTSLGDVCSILHNTGQWKSDICMYHDDTTCCGEDALCGGRFGLALRCIEHLSEDRGCIDGMGALTDSVYSLTARLPMVNDARLTFDRKHHDHSMICGPSLSTSMATGNTFIIEEPMQVIGRGVLVSREKCEVIMKVARLRDDAKQAVAKRSKRKKENEGDEGEEMRYLQCMIIIDHRRCPVRLDLMVS